MPVDRNVTKYSMESDLRRWMRLVENAGRRILCHSTDDAINIAQCHPLTHFGNRRAALKRVEWKITGRRARGEHLINYLYTVEFIATNPLRIYDNGINHDTMEDEINRALDKLHQNTWDTWTKRPFNQQTDDTRPRPFPTIYPKVHNDRTLPPGWPTMTPEQKNAHALGIRIGRAGSVAEQVREFGFDCLVYRNRGEGGNSYVALGPENVTRVLHEETITGTQAQLELSTTKLTRP